MELLAVLLTAVIVLLCLRPRVVVACESTAIRRKGQVLHAAAIVVHRCQSDVDASSFELPALSAAETVHRLQLTIDPAPSNQPEALTNWEPEALRLSSEAEILDLKLLRDGAFVQEPFCSCEGAQCLELLIAVPARSTEVELHYYYETLGTISLLAATQSAFGDEHQEHQ